MPTVINYQDYEDRRDQVGRGMDPGWVATGDPCSRCRLYGQEHRVINSSRRGHTMHTFCVGCERTANAERRLNAPRRTSVPRITRAMPLGLERRFGVEIECLVPGGRSYTLILPDGWRVGTDASLRSNNGIEVRSPALQGEDGLDQIRRVLATLAAAGATINKHCGLHVHHEVRDVGRAGAVLFAKSWTENGDLLDWLVAPSRRHHAENSGNYYCQRISPLEIEAIETRDPTRYRAVNVAAFPRYGTVEVRQHQGTLSFKKIEAWIRLGQAMIDAVAGRGRALGTHGSLRALLGDANVDEDAAAFLLGRAIQFGAPALTITGASATAIEVAA